MGTVTYLKFKKDSQKGYKAINQARKPEKGRKFLDRTAFGVAIGQFTGLACNKDTKKREPWSMIFQATVSSEHPMKLGRSGGIEIHAANSEYNPKIQIMDKNGNVLSAPKRREIVDKLPKKPKTWAENTGLIEQLLKPKR